MIYEIILNNGEVLKCWTDDVGGIINMMFMPDDIFIVRENEHPNMVSYIMPEKVSHFRFQNESEGVVKPL